MKHPRIRKQQADVLIRLAGELRIPRDEFVRSLERLGVEVAFRLALREGADQNSRAGKGVGALRKALADALDAAGIRVNDLQLSHGVDVDIPRKGMLRELTARARTHIKSSFRPLEPSTIKKLVRRQFPSAKGWPVVVVGVIDRGKEKAKPVTITFDTGRLPNIHELADLMTSAARCVGASGHIEAMYRQDVRTSLPGYDDGFDYSEAEAAIGALHSLVRLYAWTNTQAPQPETASARKTAVRDWLVFDAIPKLFNRSFSGRRFSMHKNGPGLSFASGVLRVFGFGKVEPESLAKQATRRGQRPPAK